MAIVNPAAITPYAEIPAEERDLAEDLIFNRRPDALQRLIEHFQSSWPRRRQTRQSIPKACHPALQSACTGASSTATRKTSKRISTSSWLRKLRNKQPSARHRDPQHRLLPAMKEVGDKFGSGELILPFVLQSAEVMKKSVAHLGNYLEEGRRTKGTLVLATVYGDVHDIGKNLVKTILSNNGYTVIDLGKQVPAETIITKAVEVNADAIGLSALLVSTSKQMPLDRQRTAPPRVEIPGADRRRGHQPPLWPAHPADRRRQIISGGVFYCKDAFEGLSTMDALAARNPARISLPAMKQNPKWNWIKARLQQMP